MACAAVIGVVFVDIKGFPLDKCSANGKNVGDVKIVHGGMCRNVAENFANIGLPVSFVTMFEDSGIGEEVRRRLAARGVDLKHAVTAEAGMGMWLAVMNESGDLAAAISRQPDFSALERVVEQHGDEIMQSCDNIVLEIDMRASIVEKVFALAEQYGKDVYALAGNMSVILKRPELLSRVKLFIMNEIEAGNLFGCEVKREDPASVLELIRREAGARGIRELVVTLGDQGSVYYDSQSGECGHVPAEPAVMVDSTGAGDAFFAGTVAARIRGMDLGSAARLGAKLATLTIQTDESTCPRMENFLNG